MPVESERFNGNEKNYTTPIPIVTVLLEE